MRFGQPWVFETVIMPRMTSAELAAYQARTQPVEKPKRIYQELLERGLHDMILSWARHQDPQVPCGHARMDRKSTYTEGWPDFTLLLPNGKTLLIECKVGYNGLSEEQEAFGYMAHKVGHTLFVVRSYREFIEIVKGMTQTQKEKPTTRKKEIPQCQYPGCTEPAEWQQVYPKRDKIYCHKHMISTSGEGTP